MMYFQRPNWSGVAAAGVVTAALVLGVGHWSAVGAAPVIPQVDIVSQVAIVSRAGAAVGSVPIAGGVDVGSVAGNTIAVITSASRRVSFVDASTLAVRTSTTLPQEPLAVVLSPDGALAYVASEAVITVIDTGSGAVLRSASYPGLGIECNAMTFGSKVYSIPAQLVLSPDGTRLSTLAVGCGAGSNIWTLDPGSLAVTGMALVYRETYGYRTSSLILAATNASTLLTTRFVYDQDNSPSYGLKSMATVASSVSPPDNLGETTLTELAYPGWGGLGIDLSDGTLLVPKWGGSLAVLEPSSGNTIALINGFTGSSVLVDAVARRAYGNDGSTVDLASRKALGRLQASVLPAGGTAFAFTGGRGFFATNSGLVVFNVADASFTPSQVPQVSAKVTRVRGGQATASVTWKAPAGPGSGPINGYRVVAGWINPWTKQQSLNGQGCTTKKTSCKFTVTPPPPEPKCMYYGADDCTYYYTFTVTARNKTGASVPSATIKVRNRN